MECPVCEDVKLVISSREGVEIDYCPQCRGVWLDRGELDKILDRVAASTPAAAPSGPPPAPAYRDEPRYEERRYEEQRSDDRGRYDERRYEDDRRYKKKKRGGFLEDLFDFD